MAAGRAPEPLEASSKPVIWIGSSLRDVREFPERVKDRIGYALFVAQQGAKHDDAKPLTGYGSAKVLEIVADHSTDAYRAVYWVVFVDAVYVLHAYQKKSQAGRETPKPDRELIEKRLKDARQIAAERRRAKKGTK